MFFFSQGQEFWLQNYPRNLEEPVPWSAFKEKFYNFMRLPLPRNEVFVLFCFSSIFSFLVCDLMRTRV